MGFLRELAGWEDGIVGLKWDGAYTLEDKYGTYESPIEKGT